MCKTIIEPTKITLGEIEDRFFEDTLVTNKQTHLLDLFVVVVCALVLPSVLSKGKKGRKDHYVCCEKTWGGISLFLLFT